MKKFLSALIAVVCCCCTFFISVSAEEDTYTEEEQTIIELAIDGIADYKRLYDGDITVEQFYSSINQRTGKMYYNTFVDKAIMIQILNDMGVDTESYFQDYLDWRFGEDYNSTYLNGYGAMCTYYDTINKRTHYYYCKYIIFCPQNGIDGTDGQGKVVVYFNGSGKWKTIRSDGTSFSSDLPSGGLYFRPWEISYISNFAMYGDVRTIGEDNTGVPIGGGSNLPSSPTDLSDDMFQNFLDDLSDELSKNQVDLTNLNDMTSKVLNTLNNFYNAFNGADFLTNSHFDTGIQKLIDALNDADLLTNETFTKEYLNGKEIAGTLYNVIPKDKNFFQNLTHKDTMLVEYEGKNYYLETDGTLLYKDNKYYFVDMNYFSDDGTLNNEDDSEKEMFDFSKGSIDNAFGDDKKSTFSESAAEVMAKRLKPFMRISVVVKHVVNSIDGNPTQVHAQINGIDYCVVDFAMFDNYISYIRVLTVGILYLALGIKIFKDISKVIANGG